MPKKLSSAVVGTLAVGLTLPASAAAAQAVTTPTAPAHPKPQAGPGDVVPVSPLASGVDISTDETAGTFVNPLAEEDYTFSTGQGPRCISIQGGSAHHLGQDLVAAEDTPIAAISDGTVVRTVDGTPSRAGFVVLRHNIGGQVYHSGYLHLWDAESHVSVGDTVRGGETIGLVGDSGPTITAHLHLEIWEGGWHTGEALDPAEWLAERGIDLQDDADRTQQREVPAECDYYAAESTALRAEADPESSVLTQLTRGAELTSAPGDASNGFVRVQGNGHTGWVQQGHLTPDRPAEESTGSDTAQSAGASSSAGQYRVTEPLYVRSGGGTSHQVIGGMPTGEEVSVIAADGDWKQIRRSNGQTGWSHSAYLSDGSLPESASAGATSGDPVAKAEAPSEAPEPQKQQEGSAQQPPTTDSSEPSSTSTDASDEEPSSEDSSSPAPPQPSAEESAAADDSGSHTVGQEYVNARSGAGTDHAVVTVLAPGASLEATGRVGEWVSFQRNAETLWVHSAYLRGPDQQQTPDDDQDDSEASSNEEPDSTNEAETSDTSGSSSEPDSDSAEADSAETDTSSSAPSSSTNTAGSADSADESSASEADGVRTTEWVNMRSGAGMSSAVQRTLAPETTLEVLKQEGGWYQVRAGSNTGWVWQDYLNVPSSTATPSSSGSSEESSSSSGSSSSSDAGSSSSSGSSSTSGDSSTGSSSSGSGSSSSSGSSSTSDESSSSSSGSGSGSNSSSGSGSSSSSSSSGDSSSSSSSASGARTTSGVNMRSGAGLDHGVSRTVAGGASVEILDQEGGWYQVRTGGNTGWIWQEFLDVPGSSSSSPTTAGSSSGSSESSSSSSSDSSSSSSSSSPSGSSSGGGSSSSSNSGGTGSSSGRSGPSSGQHSQSSHGPYSSAWDRLAQCESGGNWSINTGNGFYGGIQFSQQSWGWVGGSGLPHQASKQEQIERAHALWQRQGWNAWPSCSSQLGLSGDPGGWGDSYFDVHGTTQSASGFAAAGQWSATYSVPLREEPSASAEKLAQVPRGAVLDAGERSGSWIQVEFTHEDETLTGWVNTRFITAA